MSIQSVALAIVQRLCKSHLTVRVMKRELSPSSIRPMPKSLDSENGGLLFSGESIDAFHREAKVQGVVFPEGTKEIDVSFNQIAVAEK